MKFNIHVQCWTAALVFSAVLPSAICHAADANPPAKAEGAKTPAERERDAHAAALKAIHEAVERVIARHSDINADLKASLRSPTLQESWVRSVSDAARKALESTPLLKGVNVTDEMKRDFQANALTNLTESTVEEIITRSLAASKEPAKGPPAVARSGKGLAGMPRSLSASESYVHSETVNHATGEKSVVDKQQYTVNGKEVSKEDYDHAKAQIASLADDLAQLMKNQRR